MEDKEVYMEVPNDSSTLVSTNFKSLEKIRKCKDLSQDTLNYFLVKDPKFQFLSFLDLFAPYLKRLIYIFSHLNFLNIPLYCKCSYKEYKFARFYLLPKIHKRLYDVPRRPVISNCGFYTENISSFLDFHLQPLSQKVKSNIKDTNHFLRKI